MNNLEFSRNLIKGKIAEIVFEQMFREKGEFTILHSGYEYTLQELAQYQHLNQIPKVIENIKNAPDFILISQNKSEVFLVEVKYRSSHDKEKLAETASELLQTWDPSWLFVASLKGFFFSPCRSVVENKGDISKLSENWVAKDVQEKYLDLLNEFEKK